MANDSIREKTSQIRSDIRVVMSAAFVSETGIDVYSEMFRYLGKKLRRNVMFVSGFSYSTINLMLDEGKVDVGIICGLPYVMKRDKLQPTISLLLAPVMKDSQYKDKPIYYSYVIVHKNSQYTKVSDLKGSRFVFNDEISNSGYNMPRAHLISLGETSGFFSKVIRSGSHEESIRMVALGEADASAIDSLVYDYDLLNNPEYIQKLKIIKRLGPTGIPPVVVSTKLSSSLKLQIRDILMNMKNDPEGRKILDKAMVDRFIMVDDSHYDSIRKMQNYAIESDFQVIR
jgi:phosphonate transport system substrate-binding protein